jgi:hypothetical protein
VELKMATIVTPRNKKPKKDGSGEDPYVSRWKRRIEAAERRLRDHGGDIKGGEWKRLIEFFSGNQWPESSSNRGKWHRVTANQVKSNIDCIRPQLYFQNPQVRITLQNPTIAEQPIPQTQKVSVPGPMGTPQLQEQPVMDPKTGQPAIRIPAGVAIAKVGGQWVDAQEQVMLLEAIDKHVLIDTRAKGKFRRIINDALIVCYGVSKWEWVVEFENQDGEDGKSQLKISRQYPKLSRVKPWQFIWDPDLDEFDFDLADWVGEIRFLSRDDIESDKRMTVDFDHIDSESVYVDDDFKGERNPDEDVKRYKVYEIHDLKNDELLFWVEGTEKMARRESPSPYSAVEGSIYTTLGFDEVPNDSFPIALPKQIRSLAEADNFMLSYQVNHASRFNRKYQVLQNTLSKDEKEKLETGADGTVIEVQQVNGISAIQDAQISPDVYNVRGILKREITEAVGVTSYDRGTRETGVDTAFEANLIQGGSDIKIQEKRDVVIEFVKSNVRKLNQILKEFADTETVTEIVGPRGSRWVKWTNEDIKGEFVEDVDVYNSLPYTRDLEKKQAMELASVANGNPVVNQRRLWEKVFRAFNWGNEILNTPQEMAQAQAIAQQQQAAVSANQQNAQAPRPSGPGPQRASDMKGGLLGGAKKGRVA